MSFIENYTADLKTDLRHGIDKSLDKTALRIDDFLAKPHQQFVKDLTNPRHWYSFSSQDLRAFLKGEPPIHSNTALSNRISSGSRSPIKSNGHGGQAKLRGKYGYRQRMRQKLEKRDKSSVSKYNMRGLPCPTPEALTQPSEDDSERSQTADPEEIPHDIRFITSAPPAHVRVDSAHEQDIQERTYDNATVNSIQMREYLDGIISKVPDNVDMNIGGTFVLPTISQVRSDFLPTAVRAKCAPIKSIANKKQLPAIETTRVDGATVDGHPPVIEKHLIKTNTSNLVCTKSSPIKGRVLLSNVDNDIDVKARAASSRTANNNNLIVNWITTLKTQNNNTKDNSDTLDKVHSPAVLSLNLYPHKIIHLKQPTIKIPNAIAASNQMPKKPLNPKLKLRKQNFPTKDAVQASDNVFKTHLVTSELKLNIIQQEMDKLYNKDPVLRKAINRFPDDQCETEIHKRQEKVDGLKQSHRDVVMTEPHHERMDETDDKHTSTSHPDQQNKARTPTPRAPSVISIEFSGDQGATRVGNDFPIRPVSSKSKGDIDKNVSTRVPKLEIEHFQTNDISDLKKASLMPLEICSECTHQATPTRSSSVRLCRASDGKCSDVNVHTSLNMPKGVNGVSITSPNDYDRYARDRATQDDTSKRGRSNTSNQLYVHPSTKLSYSREFSSASQQDLIRCYSTLTERGYFSDLDSDYSDHDK